VASDTKHCRKCDQIKPVSAFYARRNRQNGIVHKCIECARADNRRYSKNRNAEQRRAYFREWYENRKAIDPNAGRRQWLKRYGITPEAWDALLEAQGGGCALCGKTSEARRLHVDHCHATGRVRGLLCFTCNGALGHLGDSAETITRVLAYLNG
jgi:hypothetical protein